MSNLDFYNGIMIGGVLHCLSDKQVKNKRGDYLCPCFLCSLEDECCKIAGTKLCDLLEAKQDEYFVQAANLCHQLNVAEWTLEPIE